MLSTLTRMLLISSLMAIPAAADDVDISEFDDIDTSEFDDLSDEFDDIETETAKPTAPTAPATVETEAEKPAAEAPPSSAVPAKPTITSDTAAPPPLPVAPAEPLPTKAEELPTKSKYKLGDPIPYTRREPLLGPLGFEVDIHYGLVGTGPTRLTNDVRLGIFDWWELRTTLSPYPAGLMSRFKLGSQQGPFGALVLDGGLAAFDAGFRLVTDEGEPEVGLRFTFETGLAYARALGERFSLYAQARLRYRLSLLDDDGQNAISADVHLSYDVLPNLAVTMGLGYAEALGTKVRELSVNFVNVDRAGLNHFLLRDDGWSRSVTIPLSLTYGRVESFDVDLFMTPRVWPQFDVVFGAGMRWRIPSLLRLVGL